jgi:tetraacyldisaccharide 4'-kinase
MMLRRLLAKRERFSVPIISVGNLIIGGSGKTPFVVALASRYPKTTIISRGYGRLSKGFIEVSREGEILTSVEKSGDEAMLMAQLLPECSVIVCENRKKAIKKAIDAGAAQIILDDGFNRVNIEKFEILLDPQNLSNTFPFPAGPFREFSFVSREADLQLKEERDFQRIVSFSNKREKMLLVTAIANPQRLNKYLPKGVIAKHLLPDHSYFDESTMIRVLRDSGADSLLVTQKDAVKMSEFKLPLSIMQLKLNIKDFVYDEVDTYIKHYK